MAASLSRPVGLPAASRTITPPGGSGVAAVTPASFNATEFATAMCPSNRFTKTGVAGDTASMSWLVGSAGGFHSWSSQSPPSTHSPAGVFCTRSPISLANSCGDGAWRKSTLSSCRPPPMKCTCESLNPGRTRAPPASRTLVAGPRHAARSAVVPTAATRPPTMATASASGLEGTPVQTLPLTMRRSATTALRARPAGRGQSDEGKQHQCGSHRHLRRGEPGGLYCGAPARRSWTENRTRVPVRRLAIAATVLFGGGGRLRSLSTQS